MNRSGLLVLSLAVVASAVGGEAKWHCHSLGRPKVLFLAGSPNSEMFAEQLRHVVPADVAFAPLRYGDLEMHHLCDKPLEESKEDQAYVQKEGAAYFDGLVARMREFQVVIAQLPVRSSDKAESDRLVATQKALADYARAGGKLVVINPGWEAAYEGTPLDGVLPVKSGKGKSWVYSCGPATDHPLSRGIPLEVTGAHFYGPIYEPADETCAPLTDNGKLTRFWHRRLPSGGEVVHLFQVAGEKHQWRGENAAVYDPERPDDGAAWNAFYRRLVYGLAYGDKAFPVLVKLKLPTAPSHRCGETLRVQVEIGAPLGVGVQGGTGAQPSPYPLPARERGPITPLPLREGAGGGSEPVPAPNPHPTLSLQGRGGETRAEARDVLVRVAITHRRSAEQVAREQLVTFKQGERTPLTLDCPVSLPCTDAFLLVTAQALEASSKAVLCESTAWVPYVHTVPLSVRTDKASYRPGDTVVVTATWAADAREGKYDAVAYVVDRSGRTLRRAAFEATGERTATAKLVMPDRGPEFVGGYWVTAVFSTSPVGGGSAPREEKGKTRGTEAPPTTGRRGAGTPRLQEGGGQIAGLARAQVQLDQPWTMRERFEWSVWTWGGGGRFMDLIRDAGFNALGCTGNPYSADRYAMRQYVEGTGIDTFSVTIDHDNWEAVRAAMHKTIERLNQGGPDARSKSLVSLGEESGFKGGWGTRYYWPEDKAPAVPQKVFDDYLRERYAGRLDVLNHEWGTSFASFDDIPLEKAKVKSPGQVFVTSQAWEAMQKKGETKPVISVDLARLDPKQKYIGPSAPYWETYNFFDWYYQKYCDLATEVYRSRRNPVPLTIMSAPGGFYPKVDVYNFAGLGPFYPKEAALVANAIARRDYGDVPGFSAAMWAYFDLRSLWNCTVLSSILAGNTHMDYWVDVPLTFNADLTHTRASFWTKELRERLRPIEPILLHKRFAYTDGLGMLVGQQPLPKGILGQHFGSAIDCNAPIYSALEETGYMPRVVHAKDLKGIKVLVASHAQVLSAEEGRAICDFVKGGGLLVSTPWLASCSPHGNALTVYPAEETGLADLLGFKLLNTSQAVVKEEATANPPPSQGGGGGRVGRLGDPERQPSPHPLPGRERGSEPPLALTSKGKDKVFDIAPDVEVLAKHNDGTPLLLSRRVGAGRVVYLNFLYDWDGWWNSFHEPAREAYRKLIDAIIRSDGRVKAEYFIAFESAEEVPDNKGWWQVPLKTKPAPGESVPWWSSQLYSDPSGRIKYLAIFSDHRSPKIDALIRWSRAGDHAYDLLAPEPLRGSRGRPELPSERDGYRLSLRPGEAAFWAFVPRPARLVRPEAPSRSGRIVPPGVPQPNELTPFAPRASERWPELTLTTGEFLGELRKLRSIYEGRHTGLEAKYMLSYFLNVPFRPDSRHAIVRRLTRTDWTPHIPALVECMRSGERFYLLDEDTNVGMHGRAVTIDPFARMWPGLVPLHLRRQASDARTRRVESDGFTFQVVEIGKGAFTLAAAKGRSVDRAAYHSSDFAAWHERLKKALKEIR